MKKDAFPDQPAKRQSHASFAGGRRRLLLAGLIAALTLAADHARAAVETCSETYIGAPITLEGNGGSGSRLSFFSLRCVRPVACAGTITGLADATLTDAAAGWVDDQFNGAHGSFYVEFDNGVMMDIADTVASSKTLGLAGDLRALVSVGDAYRIRAHSTVASIFGAGNEAGLASGLNPTAADNVLLYLPETQQTLTLFFYDAGPSQRAWLRADYSLAANQVIYPHQALMVRRKAAGDIQFWNSGVVKDGPSRPAIAPGYNLVGTLRAAATMKLSESNLHTGNPATGLSDGLNPTASDNLLVVRPDGTTVTYFYFNDRAGGEGWLDAAYHLANDVGLAPGSAFFIRRKPPAAAFLWNVPTE